MKSVNKMTAFLLACLLAASLAACSQTENGNTTSEGTSSSQPESSISQTSEESSSLPEESTSVPETSPTDEEIRASYQRYWNDAYGRSEMIGIYSKIIPQYKELVGVENFEAWEKQAQAEGISVNLKTFVDHFQIDRETFLNVLYTLYETDPVYHDSYATKEEFVSVRYTDEQIDALFGDDIEALREAFYFPEGFSMIEADDRWQENAPGMRLFEWYWLDNSQDNALVSHVGAEQHQQWREEMYNTGKPANLKSFVDHFQIDQATLEQLLPGKYTSEQLDALYHGDEAAILKAFDLPGGYPVF